MQLTNDAKPYFPGRLYEMVANLGKQQLSPPVCFLNHPNFWRLDLYLTAKQTPPNFVTFP